MLGAGVESIPCFASQRTAQAGEGGTAPWRHLAHMGQVHSEGDTMMSANDNAATLGEAVTATAPVRRKRQPRQCSISELVAKQQRRYAEFAIDSGIPTDDRDFRVLMEIEHEIERHPAADMIDVFAKLRFGIMVEESDEACIGQTAAIMRSAVRDLVRLTADPTPSAGTVSAFFDEWDKLDGPDAKRVERSQTEDVEFFAELKRLENGVVDTPSCSFAEVGLKVKFLRWWEKCGYTLNHVIESIERDCERLSQVARMAKAA